MTEIDVAGFPRRIHELAEPWIRERPQALACIDHDGRCLTWAGFGAAIAAATELLRGCMVRGGDRVLIVNENSVAAAASLIACSRLDAWAVPVNSRLSAPEIARIAAHCRPRAILFTDAASPEAAAHAERLGGEPFRQRDLGTLRVAGPLDCEPEPVADDNAGQVAAMIYTSGTTGEPKGVMLTHANLLFVAIVSGAIRQLSTGDLVYAVLPIAHVFGLSSTFLGTLKAGGALQFVTRFDAAHLAGALAGGVTVFQGVPAMYAKLLEHLDARGAPLVAPKLRYMSAGGSPLDIAWKKRIEARFGIALNNGYGLTEAAPTVSQTRIEAPADDDSIGPALPGLTVRMVDPDGRDVPEGEIGELWVKGPNIMKGYYRAPEVTAAAITPDGFLRTGDLARRGPAGNLYLVGRAKELIIRSGFNVYPPEVEAALNSHPSVLMSAVIGRPADGNEEVIAFVETVPGQAASPESLSEWLRERLAPYKRPRHIFLVERLPQAATGKVRKHELLPLAETMITAKDPA